MDFNSRDDWERFLSRHRRRMGVWYLDPAWDNTGFVDYPTQRDSQIRAMPLGEAFEQGAMFMWVTKSKLSFAIKAMNSWGYELKDFITWIKVDSDGYLKPAVGLYLDHNVEICLLGIKGRYSEFSCPVMMGKISDVIVAEREGKQSTKPAIAYQYIEKFMPGAVVYEAYSRYPHCVRNNFVSIGNEIPLDVATPLPELRTQKIDEEIEMLLGKKRRRSERNDQNDQEDFKDIVTQEFQNALAKIPKRPKAKAHVNCLICQSKITNQINL